MRSLLFPSTVSGMKFPKYRLSDMYTFGIMYTNVLNVLSHV